MIHRWFVTAAVPLTLAVWISLSQPVAAHGVLVRSNPPVNSTFGTPPREAVLWFNEPVEPSFTTVVVLDRQARSVGGQPTVSRDGLQIRVALSLLPRGLYTVKWRVLSAADGHTTAGVFAFAVGEAVSSASQASVAGPGPVRVAVRWIGFLAAIVLAGATFFQFAVLRPTFARLDLPAQRRQGLQETAAHNLRSLRLASAVGLLVSLAMEFTLDATLLLDAQFPHVLLGGRFWSLLGETKIGWSVVVRTAMTLVLLLPDSGAGRIFQTGAALWFVVVASVAAAFGGPVALVGSLHLAVVLLVATVYGVVTVLLALILPTIPDLDIPEFAWAAPLAASILLAGLTLAAHASGSGVLAIAADWLHMLAAALWIGGLVSLLLVLRMAEASLRPWLAREVVPRFSRVAGIGVGVMVVTGIYSAWVYIPSLQSFLATAYGRALLVKLVLVVPLVALGALNRFVLRPRVLAGKAAPVPAVHRFLRTVTGEVGLAAAVLLVVAVLTITPPAKTSAPAVSGKPLILAGIAGDLRVRLAVTPAQPGWNRLEATVALQDDQPLGQDARVLFRFTTLNEDLDPTGIIATPQGQGRYRVEGGELALAELWDVEVIVRRAGQLDVSASFPLALGEESSRATDPAASALLTAAQEAIGRTQTWRQLEQITDGVGGLAATASEFARPDRLHYKIPSGLEGIIIKDVHYQRFQTRPWERRPLSTPFAVRSPLPTDGAQGIVFGRQAQCDEEPCRVVMWRVPSGNVTFSTWIGTRTKRPHKLFMVAKTDPHYMTLHFSDFDSRLSITPPE